jgi:hypothetical protein
MPIVDSVPNFGRVWSLRYRLILRTLSRAVERRPQSKRSDEQSISNMLILSAYLEISLLSSRLDLTVFLKVRKIAPDPTPGMSMAAT